MALKKRNAAQAFASEKTILPNERKEKRSKSKQNIDTQNTPSETEADGKTQPTKLEGKKRKHEIGPKLSKDNRPTKQGSTQASRKPQHSSPIERDGNRNTIKLHNMPSNSPGNNIDDGGPQAKPRTRKALRAADWEKGWMEGEIRWLRDTDFDASFFVKGVTEVNFDGFVFTNAHARAIISAPKKFRKGLDMLNAGWIDKKGIADDAMMPNTDEVTNETLVSLAEACTDLQSVYLYGRLLSDLALQAFFEHCPKLESFTICSNGINTNGNLRGSALKILRKNPDWAPELWKLCLHGYDGENRKLKRAIRKLTAARPELFISIEDNVTRLSSKMLGGHEDVISLDSDSDSDTDIETSDDSDATDDEGESWYDGFTPTLYVDDMANEMLGDSSLGDFMFNQYANGNHMDGFMF